MAKGTGQTTGAKKKSRKKAKPKQEQESFALETIQSGVGGIWSVEAAKGIDNLMRVAEVFSNSGLVPDRYKDKKNDCAIVIAMALKHGADVLGFMQNVYVVYGTPGMESKLAIALVNNACVFEGPIQYKMTGEKHGQDRECTAWGIDAKSGEKCEMSCSIADANRAGWTKPVTLRNGKGTIPSKWTVMPEMMLRYRAAMNLIRVYHPEILFGMRTVAELEDIGPRDIDVEVIPPHRDEIKEAVKSATASSTPSLPAPSPDEKPLSESLAESSTPIEGAQQGGVRQEPESSDDTTAPAPAASKSGQMSLGAVADEPPRDARFAVLDAPEPKTDADMRAERIAVVKLYSDLARQAGEDRKEISTTTTGTLKDECRRLIKAMDLL